MKNVLVVFSVFCLINTMHAQDSLTVKDFENVSYHFTIENNTFKGNGADFLEAEAQKNQFIMLGEYHGSETISEFTKAFIPIYNKYGCKNFGLEIGASTAKILTNLSKKPETTIAQLKTFNTSYKTVSKKRSYTPIPFFSNISDAEFLADASKLKWNLIGLDQEFKFGFIPLVELAYNNLSDSRKRELKEKLTQTKDTLLLFYTKEIDYYDGRTTEKKRFAKLFKNSNFINSFLNDLASNHPENKKIVDDIRTSNEIYWLSNVGRYWDGNAMRTSNFIRNFGNAMNSSNFNKNEDKMLIKIGALHSAKGLNNYFMYDIGNSVAEFARFNGTSSLHIRVMNRYYFDEGKVEDGLDYNTKMTKAFKDFLKLGKKDEWTIIDLRPMRELVYYKRIYLLNDRVREYFDRYDVIIISPTEVDVTHNYDD